MSPVLASSAPAQAPGDCSSCGLRAKYPHTGGAGAEAFVVPGDPAVSELRRIGEPGLSTLSPNRSAAVSIFWETHTVSPYTPPAGSTAVWLLHGCTSERQIEYPAYEIEPWVMRLTNRLRIIIDSKSRSRRPTCPLPYVDENFCE